jgi:hypothetical protein
MLLNSALIKDVTMKRISASMVVFLAGIAAAVAADPVERAESLPDAYPECMQVNGPDCVLRSQASPARTAAPAGTIISPATIVPPGAPAAVTAVPVSTATEVTNVIMPPPAERRTIAAPGK